QVSATAPRTPRAVGLSDNAVFEFERRIGRIVGGGGVGSAVLVDPGWNMGGPKAADRLDLAEQALKDVAPMRKHVEDIAAAVLFSVVPGRSLRRLPVAFEHLVAELAAHREDATEKTGGDQ